MALIQSAVRKIIKTIVRIRIPGRYVLIEWLHPLFVEPTRIQTQDDKNVRWELDLNDQIQRQIFFGLYDSTLRNHITVAGPRSCHRSAGRSS